MCAFKYNLGYILLLSKEFDLELAKIELKISGFAGMTYFRRGRVTNKYTENRKKRRVYPLKVKGIIL